MSKTIIATLAVALGLAGAALAGDPPAKAAPEWSLNATIIEACTCPMFCQCYFSTMPAAHGPGCCGSKGPADKEGARYCRFNNAFKVNSGSYGATKLDGLKYWVAGDLGGDFSKGQMDWAVLHFEKSATKDQRDAVAAILGHLYPVKWASFTIGSDADMEWSHDKDGAHALLGGGKLAEVKLHRFQGMSDEPIVIQNLKYWGAPRNTGFMLFPSEVEAYRTGDKPYEIHNSNGFMITFDIASKDMAGDGGKAKGGGY